MRNPFDELAADDELAEAIQLETQREATPESPKHLDVRAVSIALGVSTQRVYELIQKGKLKASRVGPSKGTAARTVVEACDLDAFLAAPQGLPFGSRTERHAGRPSQEDSSQLAEISHTLRDILQELRSLKAIAVVGGSSALPK